MIEPSTLEKDAILQYHFKKMLEISKNLFMIGLIINPNV